MEGYANPERLSAEIQFRRPVRFPKSVTGAGMVDLAVVDVLLSQLAELVVQRLMDRTADAEKPVDEWLDSQAAAEYLGVHRDTLRKLAAERAAPVHQDGPGCKLYFRRDELDEWRRSSRAAGRSRLRAVS